MQINIYIDFGQDYKVALTPQSARKLYNELHALFGEQPRQYYFPPVTTEYNLANQPCTTINASVPLTPTTPEVKEFLTEESPEMLREKGPTIDCYNCQHDIDCGCNHCITHVRY